MEYNQKLVTAIWIIQKQKTTKKPVNNYKAKYKLKNKQ